MATELTLSSTEVTFFEPGETTELVATVTDQNGEVMDDAPVTWSSSSPFVADVTEGGLVTARHGGATNITASSGPARATASVTVVTPLVILTTSLPPAAPGVSYAQALAAEGGEGSLTWALTDGSLPTGLELSAPTGEISGTPTGSTSTFTVSVTASGGESASRTLTLEINFTVNTVDDVDDGVCQVGHCSLREALAGANAHAGPDEIRFAIPGEGVRTIRPRSPLPEITSTVVIDGYTQPGARPNTRDSAAGSDAVLRVELDGTNAGASTTGLRITGGRSVIRGLVINRFGGFGVVVAGNPGTVVEGNYIGTDASGTIARGNGTVGIGTSVSYTTIGGITNSARNIVSGNGAAGVQLSGVGAGVRGSIVQGNFIGTDVTGMHALGNGTFGISVFDNAGTLIGGPEPGAGNVISGNEFTGLLLAGAAGTVVLGNLIGTDVTGAAELGNRGDGIGLVSYNASIGLFHATDNVIGGAETERGNVIRGNARAGVSITDAQSHGNAVLGNSIFANGGLGIDLDALGVATNDPGDADVGANGLQNYPVLTSVTSAAGAVAAAGQLSSSPATTFRVELFANDACDTAGHGEGQIPLGSVVVTTGDNGDATFTVTLPGMSHAGRLVTATATDPDGNTSEFSACTSVTPAP